MGYYSKDSRKTLFLISILFMFILLIFACSPTQKIVEKTMACPTSSMEPPILPGDKPKLIIILIKEQSDFKEYAIESLNILSRVLPEAIEPGDRVVLLSMEEMKLKNAVIFDGEVSPVDRPSIANSPTPPPTIGPLPTPTLYPEGVYMEAVATQDAIRFMKSTQISATKAAFEYECAKEAWVRDYDVLWKTWDSKKQAAISQFVNEFTKNVEDNKLNGFQKNNNQVFEALQLASSIINTECSNYSSCDLVIFSDFYDFRNYRPSDITISLPEINVEAIMPNCNYLSECEKEIDFWTENFTAYGAANSQFVINRDMGQELLNYLRR